MRKTRIVVDAYVRRIFCQSIGISGNSGNHFECLSKHMVTILDDFLLSIDHRKFSMQIKAIVFQNYLWNLMEIN